MEKKKLQSIAILCSGGDSPGMNCAIRSVVRTSIGEKLKVFGIQRGYQGLIEGHFRELGVASVGNILHTGGTILQTSRSKEFMSAEGRKKAADMLKKFGVDGLVVIGGNGSYKGAKALQQEHAVPVIGIPGTIDNDISGTDYTIGFDTAVQTAIEAVDKIRDTASSHERIFLVEVMGRKAPAIAIHVAVCTGAENIIFPNKKLELERVVADIKRGVARGKNSSIIIVAEGDKPGFSYDIQKDLESRFQLDSHVCILGHTQRGGHPSHIDRFIGSRMGNEAVKSLLSGCQSGATAYVQGHVKIVPLDDCLNDKIDYELPYLELVRTLSI